MENSLKIERAKKKITQEQLAQKVNVSRQTINSLEAGRYVPSSLLALKIAKFFNTKLENIFKLENTD